MPELNPKIINPKMFATVLSGAALMAATFFYPFEGGFLTTYSDPPGIATDCIGHTVGVKPGDKETPEKCLLFLKKDTADAASEVERDIHVKMSPPTEAAFISFVFNEGAGTFRRSSIVRDANAGHLEKACDDLAACVQNKAGKWVGFGCGWAGDERLPGLERRRAGEKQLCLEGLKNVQ